MGKDKDDIRVTGSKVGRIIEFKARHVMFYSSGGQQPRAVLGAAVYGGSKGRLCD